ncbi:MAG: NlpC/P60 family protein [Desulfuromonadaceae bacterium]|nr:NlpC/P60 family protein [Desulfuromonadaceae bacterium]MDD2848106.1 NlpC/P60 family protein [Desulfuromonadaceae bacterium]MDD4132053.1 NlpC/P60 family protein [Desulfuromonadaceae bacterium]
MSAETVEYGVALTATPVLNTSDFQAVFGGANGKELKADRCGQVRELEYIALPGTVFRLLKKQRYGADDIYQVETDEYAAPANVRLYVACRFLRLGLVAPVSRRVSLPPRERVVATLRASGGNPYVWGGNVPDGVPELESWFYRGIGENDRKRLTLSGLDCSGLLYHATGGWTPRNTSQLITFGQGVPIAGKSVAEIASLLQPLDLIVWNGHVVIVLDRQTAIESRLQCGRPGNGGVVMTELAARVAAVMRTRRPVNIWQGSEKTQDAFVVRRWYVGD